MWRAQKNNLDNLEAMIDTYSHGDGGYDYDDSCWNCGAQGHYASDCCWDNF